MKTIILSGGEIQLTVNNPKEYAEAKNKLTKQGLIKHSSYDFGSHVSETWIDEYRMKKITHEAKC
mgnify:CR=1 FL=1